MDSCSNGLYETSILRLSSILFVLLYQLCFINILLYGSVYFPLSNRQGSSRLNIKIGKCNQEYLPHAANIISAMTMDIFYCFPTNNVEVVCHCFLLICYFNFPIQSIALEFPDPAHPSTNISSDHAQLFQNGGLDKK